MQEKQDLAWLFHPPSEAVRILLHAVLLFTKFIAIFAKFSFW
jgi:hypothetical protein